MQQMAAATCGKTGALLWPAFAAFMEDVSGSLTAGKYADFVVLDQDIMTVPEDRILETRVLRTVLGGKAVYQRD